MPRSLHSLARPNLSLSPEAVELVVTGFGVRPVGCVWLSLLHSSGVALGRLLSRCLCFLKQGRPGLLELICAMPCEKCWHKEARGVSARACRPPGPSLPPSGPDVVVCRRSPQGSPHSVPTLLQAHLAACLMSPHCRTVGSQRQGPGLCESPGYLSPSTKCTQIVLE